MFKVQSNIPMPGKMFNRKIMFPFDQMKVGDSFRFPKKMKTLVYSHAYLTRVKTGKKYSVRKTRCWRVK